MTFNAAPLRAEGETSGSGRVNDRELTTRHCEEAKPTKQSRGRGATLDCFVALLLAMTDERRRQAA
jgi:hypothetical protein